MENYKAALRAKISSAATAHLYGLVGKGVNDIKFNDEGMLVFILSDGREVILEMPKTAAATEKSLGVVQIGENLKITPEGLLSVDTAGAVEKDNTKPVTSGAVHMEIGNIEVLLENI